jgi:hypothetical protein
MRVICMGAGGGRKRNLYHSLEEKPVRKRSLERPRRSSEDRN